MFHVSRVQCVCAIKVFKRQNDTSFDFPSCSRCCCLLACKSPTLLVIIMLLLARIEAKCRGGLHASPHAAPLSIAQIYLTRPAQNGASEIVN